MGRIEPQQQAEGLVAAAAAQPFDGLVGQDVVDIAVVLPFGLILAAVSLDDARMQVMRLALEAEIIVPWPVEQRPADMALADEGGFIALIAQQVGEEAEVGGTTSASLVTAPE
jgi:hypothetical protein